MPGPSDALDPNSRLKFDLSDPMAKRSVRHFFPVEFLANQTAACVHSAAVATDDGGRQLVQRRADVTCCFRLGRSADATHRHFNGV